YQRDCSNDTDSGHPLGLAALRAGNVPSDLHPVSVSRDCDVAPQPDAGSGGMTNSSFLFADMLQTIADKGRRFLSLAPREDENPIGAVSALCDTLLSSRGEASGMALAQNILRRWQRFTDEQQRAFMEMLL